MGESDFQVTEPDEFTMTVDDEIAWINKLNCSETSLALVAEINGYVVGLIDFHGNSKRRRLSHSGAFGMSVLQEYRDQGIGSVLIESLLAWAKECKLVEKVSLAVLATNQRAIFVYKKLGFIEEGRRIREVKIGPGKYVDDILMYKFVK